MVGCVIARGEQVLGEGWHKAFGKPHAEVNALSSAGDVRGATVYVTLEPCCHEGKTPPCTTALIEAGVGEVVVAQTDPFPQVAGRGLRVLEAAGINVRHGLLEASSATLNAPYLKLMQSGRPWVTAKWAMTLDGKIASHTGNSQWISSEASRQRVHQLRGRMDAIMVGVQTAIADDPLLTARPGGARVARRIVVDSTARLPLESQLVKTARATATLLATGPAAPKQKIEQLQDAGVENWSSTRGTLTIVSSSCWTNSVRDDARICWWKAVARCWAASLIDNLSTRFTSSWRRRFLAECTQ